MAVGGGSAGASAAAAAADDGSFAPDTFSPANICTKEQEDEEEEEREEDDDNDRDDEEALFVCLAGVFSACRKSLRPKGVSLALPSFGFWRGGVVVVEAVVVAGLDVVSYRLRERTSSAVFKPEDSPGDTERADNEPE